MTMRTSLAETARTAWVYFESTSRHAFVVRPSMPILYFGNSRAYSDSAIRIVTVGLNPSHEEFPGSSPWLRFPGGENCNSRNTGEGYLKLLDDYYGPQAYMRWFGSYERVLSGMEASYFSGARHTVLHTDVCSVLATNPTWSRLQDPDTAVLESFGGPLWRELIQALRPHVIIASIAEHRLQTMGQLGPASVLHVVERGNPYQAIVREVITGSHTALLLFGRAANTPFGTVSDVDKRVIGRRMLEKVQRWL